MTGFRIGAFAIILGERDEAFLREDLDPWNLPGGAVERGESPWEAVETAYFALEGVPKRSNRRHVEMVLDARDSSGGTVMKTQAGPSSRELIERGLL